MAQLIPCSGLCDCALRHKSYSSFSAQGTSSMPWVLLCPCRNDTVVAEGQCEELARSILRSSYKVPPCNLDFLTHM